MTAPRRPPATPFGDLSCDLTAAPLLPASEVALAAGGDRRAFARLYQQHVGRVYTLCMRMVGDQVTAEELTQDVFVRAWEKLALFRAESAFSTWLHRVAVNVVLNHRKAEARRRGRVDDDPELLDGAPAHHAHPGVSMDLEHAIAQLPRGARTVFVLHDVEGYKHEEIATTLGITAGGSKAQLHRARLLLRQALER